MTPRQRRGILLLVLAAVGAVFVFAAISNYVDEVRKDVEPKTSVLVLTRSVPELQPIPLDAVRRKSVPQKWASRLALNDPTQIGPRVPSSPLPAGVELQEGMLVEPPALEEGQQEISILINADTGVAGKLQPGDSVDILATFAADQDTRSPASARTLIRRARVVTVGTPASRNRPDADNADAGSPSAVVLPVTFALRPTLALRLAYAESFASEIRLALIRRGDEARRLPPKQREFTLPRTQQRAANPDALLETQSDAPETRARGRRGG